MSARKPTTTAFESFLFPLTRVTGGDKTNAIVAFEEKHTPASRTTLYGISSCCSCLTLEDEMIDRTKFPKRSRKLEGN